MTTNSQFSAFSNSLKRDVDAESEGKSEMDFDTESMMRSSMYSTRSKLFNAAQDDTVTVVLDSLKVSNVLELTAQ